MSVGYTIAVKMKKAFTLIELLVVISVIGVLMALSIFGLQGAREASRDGKRKSDLELIRSGLEIYKSDCNVYPSEIQLIAGEDLNGDGSLASCAVTNIYISSVPTDPIDSRVYLYSSDGTSYELCAGLEQGDDGDPVSCGGTSNCGGGTVCNYEVNNP